MCRCDYGICKENCSCRCHLEGSSEMIIRLREQLKALQAEKSMINEAWCNALHKNDVVDMIDAEGENRKAILQMVQEELNSMRKRPV